MITRPTAAQLRLLRVLMRHGGRLSDADRLVLAAVNPRRWLPGTWKACLRREWIKHDEMSSFTVLTDAGRAVLAAAEGEDQHDR
jgi:hypothetical protein